MTRTIEVGKSPIAVASAAGAAWVSSEEDGDLGGSARAAELGRTSRQSRSAFGRKNPRQRSGSAGRPSTSHTVASAIVPPSEAVRQSQVQNGRRRKRALAPRKSAKKSRSGMPSFAPTLQPGTGNVDENAQNSPRGFFVPRSFLGGAAPAPDEVDPRNNRRRPAQPHARLLEVIQESAAQSMLIAASFAKSATSRRLQPDPGAGSPAR